MRRIKISEDTLRSLYLEQRLGIPAVAGGLNISKTTAHRKLNEFHISIRSMSVAKRSKEWTGKCIDCKIETELTRCKKCSDKKSYIQHRDERLKQQKEYRSIEENKERFKEYYKQYCKDNPEKIRAIKRKYKLNSEFRKLRNRLHQRLKFALNQYLNTGKCKTSDEYGINYKAIIEHLDPCPGEISKYHIDHIFPLSAFDLNDPIMIRKAFAPENHQWLLVKENLIKHTKYNLCKFKSFISACKD